MCVELSVVVALSVPSTKDPEKPHSQAFAVYHFNVDALDLEQCTVLEGDSEGPYTVSFAAICPLFCSMLVDVRLGKSISPVAVEWR